MVYEGRVWQHYSVCVEALQVCDQEGQPKENYSNQDGIELRLQLMYLRHQQSGKNGSYWFYEAGNIKLYTTDSPAFPLRETRPRTHQDSILIQRIQSHSPEKPSSWCWPALALTLTQCWPGWKCGCLWWWINMLLGRGWDGWGYLFVTLYKRKLRRLFAALKSFGKWHFY